MKAMPIKIKFWHEIVYKVQSSMKSSMKREIKHNELVCI